MGPLSNDPSFIFDIINVCLFSSWLVLVEVYKVYLFKEFSVGFLFLIPLVPALKFIFLFFFLL